MTIQTEPRERNEVKEGVLCRSRLYGALSLALHEPTSETLGVFCSAGTAASILEAVSFLDAVGCEDEGVRLRMDESDSRTDLVGPAQAWIKSFSSLNLSALQSAHSRLFGHAARGVVCPYETEYGQEGLFQQPQQLASLNGLYGAFGLQVRQVERERADHISCELEFMKFLSDKEIYALEQGQDVMLAATRQAARHFLKQHLGRFGRAFGAQLKKYDSGGFLGKAANLLVALLTVECLRLGVQAGAVRLPLRTVAEDRVPMACAGQSDLVQIENEV